MSQPEIDDLAEQFVRASPCLLGRYTFDTVLDADEWDEALEKWQEPDGIPSAQELEFYIQQQRDLSIPMTKGRESKKWRKLNDKIEDLLMERAVAFHPVWFAAVRSGSPGSPGSQA